MTTCMDCGANWQAGAHTEGCEQCGGGALDIACLICGGRCGARWKRQVMDSRDSGVAHWMGGCKLPSDEQRRLMAERAREEAEQRQRTKSQ
jgi:hypothetical protein